MSSACCKPITRSAAENVRVRRMLWIALLVNAAMFAIEVGAGWSSGSLALLADAIDFFGDAANYGLSLAALALAPHRGTQAARVKGITMAAFGAFVLASAIQRAMSGAPPEPITMGLVGALALAANVCVAWMLYALRDGEAHLRAAWLCSRNDALGNVAVLLAAAGVFGTDTAWPDLIVAAIIGGLALRSGAVVLRRADGEMRRGPEAR